MVIEHAPTLHPHFPRHSNNTPRGVPHPHAFCMRTSTKSGTERRMSANASRNVRTCVWAAWLLHSKRAMTDMALTTLLPRLPHFHDYVRQHTHTHTHTHTHAHTHAHTHRETTAAAMPVCALYSACFVLTHTNTHTHTHTQSTKFTYTSYVPTQKLGTLSMRIQWQQQHTSEPSTKWQPVWC